MRGGASIPTPFSDGFPSLCAVIPWLAGATYSSDPFLQFPRDSFFERPPAPCILLQDDIGFGSPLEGLRFGVALGEPDLDGSLEISDALEHAAADCLARDFGEQPFDEVDPGR